MSKIKTALVASLFACILYFLCRRVYSYGELAKIVMQSRQLNHPMNTLTKGEGKELTKALVIEAYKQPLYSTTKYKRQAVIQFANEVRSACLRTIK